MNRREFLELVSKAVVAATVTPPIPLDATSPAMPAYTGPVMYDANSNGLFISWMNAANTLIVPTMKKLVASKDRLTAHGFSRLLRSVDNTHRSYRTMRPIDQLNEPATKAMLEIYDAEMQSLRDIIANKKPEDKVTFEEVATAADITRGAWRGIVQLTRHFPQMWETVNQVMQDYAQFDRDRASGKYPDHAESYKSAKKPFQEIESANSTDVDKAASRYGGILALKLQKCLSESIKCWLKLVWKQSQSETDN